MPRGRHKKLAFQHRQPPFVLPTGMDSSTIFLFLLLAIVVGGAINIFIHFKYVQSEIPTNPMLVWQYNFIRSSFHCRRSGKVGFTFGDGGGSAKVLLTLDDLVFINTQISKRVSAHNVVSTLLSAVIGLVFFSNLTGFSF